MPHPNSRQAKAARRRKRRTLDNIVPACGPCNASKSNDEATSWMRRKKLDERAFLTRLVQVRAALLEIEAPAPSGALEP